MALVDLFGNVFWPGFSISDTGLVLTTQRTLDAVGEYQAFCIQAREDMTISHVGNYVTATGSPTMDVRIETVSTTDGFPTGTLWGTNTNVVTGALTTGFTLHALTAPAVISKTQIFAVRFNFLSGAIIVTRSAGIYVSLGMSLPYEVFSIGTPTRGQLNLWGDVGFGSSSSTFYSVYGFIPFSLATVLGFNSPTKRGARFQVPFHCRCCGLRTMQLTAGGDMNILITDDAGAELGGSSTFIDAAQRTSSTSGIMNFVFNNPVTLYPGIWYRAVMEPTTATNARLDYATLPDANYRSGWPGGMNFYLAEFSGTWTDSPDKVPILDLMIDQLSGGSSSPTYAVGPVA